MPVSKVTIYLNGWHDPHHHVVPFSDGYHDEYNAMGPVFTYAVALPPPATTHDPGRAVCDLAFAMFQNQVGDRMPGDARRLAWSWKHLGLRSLSVGDVAEVDGVPYACASPAGWLAIDPATMHLIPWGTTCARDGYSAVGTQGDEQYWHCEEGAVWLDEENGEFLCYRHSSEAGAYA